MYVFHIIIALCLTTVGGFQPKDASLPLKVVLNSAKKASNIITLFDLKNQYGKPGNTLYCPLSFDILMVMLYSGANGKTKSEIQKLLKLPNDENAVISGYQKIMDVTKLQGQGQIKLGNGMFLSKAYTPNQNYLNVLKNNFKSAIESIDFHSNDAAQKINKWIAEKTNNKIKNALSSVAKESILVLVNTAYFKQRWSETFDKKDTVKGTFNSIDGPSSGTEFMQATSIYNWYKDKNKSITIVAKPYQGLEFAMIIVMPSDYNQLQMLEEKLIDGSIQTPKQSSLAYLKMPKFKLKSEFQLTNKLKSVGVKDMFLPSADFGRMTKGPVHVSNIVQKTFLEVTEEGTEAASVTMGAMGSAIADTVEPEVIEINKPFVFAIQHIDTQSALFIGRVTSLTKVKH